MNEQRNLSPAGMFKGTIEGYTVLANRHRTDQGTDVWHMRVQANDDGSDFHSYWVENGVFRADLGTRVHDSGFLTVGAGANIEPPLEIKNAALAAIARWQANER